MGPNTYKLSIYEVGLAFSETRGGDQVVCYSRKIERFLFPGPSSTIFGSAEKNLRVIDNLKEDFVGGSGEFCYESRKYYGHVVVEFTTVKKISGLKFRVRSSATHWNYKKMAVKVGNVTSAGDFSSYSLLTVVDNPLVVASEDFIMEGDEPLYGKFVALLELGYATFFICSLEIY